MPRHRSAPPKLLIAARSVWPGPGGFGSHGALAYLGMGPGRIRCQMMLVLGEKPRLIRLHVPWFFFSHVFCCWKVCSFKICGKCLTGIMRRHHIIIYIYIISLSSLDVCWLPTPRTFWRWVRTCYRKSPVCWSLGWGRFQVFFPYWLTETITHITHQKHIHISTFTLLLPIALRWWWKERERGKKHIIENIDHVYTHHIWRSTNIVYFPYCFVPLFGLALRSWGVPSPFAVPFWATCSTCRIFATSSQRSPGRGCCSWELLGGEGGKRSGGRKIRGRNCGVELVLGMGCIAVGG